MPFATYAIPVYAFFAAYAITKTELMDIRVAITRSAAYGFVGALVIASFAMLNLIKMPQLLVFVTNTSLALLWAVAGHRLRAFIQTPLEEKWITDWYNSDKLVNNIATKLIPVVEKEDAFKIIAEQLKSSIKIKEIEVAMGKPATAGKPAEEYKDITKTKKGLVIPLTSSDGIEGILILGQKVSEDPYNDKDLTIFRTIMIQTQAIFDRIRPYEKIKHELEKAERALERSQRLASLGTLIAGVTHEIRNPMTVIRSLIEGLFNQPRDEAYMKDMQKTVLHNADRIEAIVQNMLGMAREKSKAAPVDVDLNDTIEKALQFFPSNHIKLVRAFGQVPPVKGEPNEISEVFVNLIQNAVEAMKGKDDGTLTIRTFLDGARVAAEVADTGKGIAPELQEKIFDPFFSTRHEGVGLGLSIAYRIIREHGGDISVKSEVGRGTTFKILF